MCYKIVFFWIDVLKDEFSAFSHAQSTRGHPYKLFVARTVCNTRKHFFCARVIKPWNNLNGTKADFSTVGRFKSLLRRLDLRPAISYIY